MKKILFFLLILGLSPLSLYAGDIHVGAVYKGNIITLGHDIYQTTANTEVVLTIYHNGMYVIETYNRTSRRWDVRDGVIDFVVTIRGQQVIEGLREITPGLHVFDESSFGWANNRPEIYVRQRVVGADRPRTKEAFLGEISQGILKRVAILPSPQREVVGGGTYRIDTKVTQKSNNSISSVPTETKRDSISATPTSYAMSVTLEKGMRSIKVTRTSDGQIAYICLKSNEEAIALLGEIEKNEVSIYTDDTVPLKNLLLERGDMLILPDVNDAPCK